MPDGVTDSSYRGEGKQTCVYACPKQGWKTDGRGVSSGTGDLPGKESSVPEISCGTLLVSGGIPAGAFWRLSADGGLCDGNNAALGAGCF